MDSWIDLDEKLVVSYADRVRVKFVGHECSDRYHHKCASFGDDRPGTVVQVTSPYNGKKLEIRILKRSDLYNEKYIEVIYQSAIE